MSPAIVSATFAKLFEGKRKASGKMRFHFVKKQNRKEGYFLNESSSAALANTPPPLTQPSILSLRMECKYGQQRRPVSMHQGITDFKSG